MSLLFLGAIGLILQKLADKKEMHNIFNEFQFWPDWTADNLIDCFLPSKNVSKSKSHYNGVSGVSVFLGCFTYLRTSQNILIIC